MHSTLLLLVGFAILGSASPLAGVSASLPNSTSTLHHNNTIAVKDVASQSTNNSRKTSLAAAAIAQDPPPSINDLPECCIPCVKDSIEKETDCALEDLACVCEHKNDIGQAAKDCVVEKCGLNNAIKVVGPAVKKLCAIDDDKEVEIWE